MRVPRLFVDRRLVPHSQVEIDKAGAQYLGRVLRVRAGHHIVLFDGSGREFPAQIAEVGKHSIKALLGEATDPATESPVNTILGLCLSKGDRFDWAVQKATELGVSVIQPLESERVDFAIPEDRIEKRVAHWQQIAISACEQSGRAVIPLVQEPTSLPHWLSTVEADCKLVLDPVATSSELDDQPAHIALLIGPEGGLTPSELALASESGFTAIQLGPRILRTETAPLVALTVIGARWGDINA